MRVEGDFHGRKKMKDDGYYARVLRWCALSKGKYVHAELVSWQGPLGLRTFLANLLIHMYGRCRSAGIALSLFRQITHPNIWSWNIVIRSCANNHLPQDALHLFRRMCMDTEPSKVTLLAVLQACSCPASLEVGREIHQRIASDAALHSDVALHTSLVNMYAKCGSLEDARRVFNAIDYQDAISWTAMITAYARNGHNKEALELFQQMEIKGIKPDKITFVSALEACAGLTLPEIGRVIHEKARAAGLHSDVTVSNALLNMYGKCGSLIDAESIFSRMPIRDTISWTTMITASAHNGHGKNAVRLFWQMESQGIIPSRITFLSVLDACADLACLESGKAIHKCIIHRGLVGDVAVCNALLDMYSKCSSLDEAIKVFEAMHCRDVISWNTMIAAFAREGHSSEALEYFQRMRAACIKPSQVTFLNVLDACHSLHEGKIIRECIDASGFSSDSRVKTALLSMYGKCGSLKDARLIFGEMHGQSIITCNAMIGAYSRNGQGREALDLIHQMVLKGVRPDRVTFLSVLDSSNSWELLDFIIELIAVSGLESNMALDTALVNAYCKSGRLGDARMLFDRMHQRNVISWNIMIAAYIQNRHSREALKLFQSMETEGITPDKITFLTILNACSQMGLDDEDGCHYSGSLTEGKQIHERIIACRLGSDIAVNNALLSMYGKCGGLKDAQVLFNEMQQRDVISWTAMIAAYTQNGLSEKAHKLYEQLTSEGFMPTAITFASVLAACASSAALECGKEIHRQIANSAFGSDIALCNALINMYGKCGSLEDAHIVFDGMHEWSSISWSTMIAAYAQNGHSKEALGLFQLMIVEHVKPDGIVFLSILTACCHTGLLVDGWHYFTSINREHGLMPSMEHYMCMLDILGRGGCLEEAVEMMQNMHVQPSVGAWMALLAACQIHGDIERAVCAAEHAIMMDPKDASPYILLSDMYAAAGKWHGVAKIKKAMDESGVKNPTGGSEVEDSSVHMAFF